MYENYYQFSSKPFQLTPDPGFFFKSKGHQRAMAYLRYGLQQGEGFIVITGDVGTGKTTLVNNLFNDIDPQKIIAAKIVSTNLDDGDFLALVASRFGIQVESDSKGKLIAAIEEFLVTCHEAGQRALVVVDEAQNLPVKSLEELRMLSNFTIDGRPLLQSFLLGQREFRATLRSPGLEQLKQRVIAAYHLKSLSDIETREYIEHRLRTVGWNNTPAIEPDVFLGVYRFTRGIPRRINTLMDRLLLNASLDQETVIGLRSLNTIIEEVQVEQRELDDLEDELGIDPDQLPQSALSSDSVHHAMEAAHDDARVEGLERRLAAIEHNLSSLTTQLGEFGAAVSASGAASGAAYRPPHVDDDEGRGPGVLLSIVISILVIGGCVAGYIGYRLLLS